MKEAVILRNLSSRAGRTSSPEGSRAQSGQPAIIVRSLGEPVPEGGTEPWHAMRLSAEPGGAGARTSQEEEKLNSESHRGGRNQQR